MKRSRASFLEEGVSNEEPKAGERVQCILEGRRRMGPLEVVAREGRHAFVRLDSGLVMPLPIRALVRVSPTPRRRRGRTRGSSSGERLLSL